MGVFDNKWQLAANTDVPGQYAVLIRGTIDAAGSVIDDLLAVMIPASGSLFGLPYQFAADSEAGVHLGFALATLILLFDRDNGILTQLNAQRESIREVFIAGHSQGAAIAALCRSFFSYLQLQTPLPFTYKTYMFALPKPGNDHYGMDFDRIASIGGMGFSVNNSQDWVPQAPLTFQLPGDVNDPNPLSVHFVEHLALAPIAGAITLMHQTISLGHRTKHLPQMAALTQVALTQTAVQPAPVIAEQDDPRILPTLNFAGCGSPIPLAGVPGANPCDPRDFFWQHHAAMYYRLLAGIPIPTDCSG